ncbi:MAG TPA: DUF362 domain-containing protein [Bryobacteraceae bacterium]|nr:DUF362 domain-containing protein [Bryobacteraceae bacterium]
MLRRSFLRSLAAAPAAGICHAPLIWTPEAMAQQRGMMAPPGPFHPEEANSPIGDAKGIHPGRVVWTRDASVTNWDGATGHWWDDANTNGKAVQQMTSRLLQNLTGRKNDRQAWDALFRNFNETHGGGRGGYRPGQRIAIKINCNQDRSPEWGTSAPAGARGGAPAPALNGLPSPHAVVALVEQLIEAGGVHGEDILLYDAAAPRNIGEPIVSRIHAHSNPQFQAVKFLAGGDYHQAGRMLPIPDMANPIRFSNPEVPVAYLPQQVAEAHYVINMALLRAHGMAGVTLIGKNHFGSVHFPHDGGWSPRTLHGYVQRTQAMGSYNCLVELMGHRHLGGKTMLYMLDGLYTAAHNEGNVYRWQSFGDHWASSLLASQDGVALDSVGLDLLHSEPRATEVRGHPDNYLHEAAQAAKPPSGTVYNPDGSGRLASLGVHEHWNNSEERKYSRNLGRKQGIELIAMV